MDILLLLTAVGTIGLFILEVHRYLIKPYIQSQNDKRIKEEEEAKAEIQKYSMTITEINDCIGNLSSNFRDRFETGSVHTIQDLLNNTIFFNQIKEFKEEFRECEDWCYTARRQIEPIIKKQLRDMLKNTSVTLENNSIFLEKMMAQNYVLVHRHILAGTEIDTSYMDKYFPEIVGYIRDNLTEPERETQMNQFFNRLNSEFLSNRILVRYRHERDKLIELGHKIIEDLTIKLNSLQKSERSKVIK